MINEWVVFIAKLHPTCGRVLWRSFAFRQHIAPLKFLHYQAERVRDAEARLSERVGTYNSTHFATVPQGMRLTRREPTLRGDAQTAASVVAASTPCTVKALDMDTVGRVDQAMPAAGSFIAMLKAHASLRIAALLCDDRLPKLLALNPPPSSPYPTPSRLHPDHSPARLQPCPSLPQARP